MTEGEAADRAVYLLKLAVLVYPAVRPAALAKHKPPRSVDEALAELDGPHHPVVAALIGSELAALRAGSTCTAGPSAQLEPHLGAVLPPKHRRPEAFPAKDDAAYLFLHMRSLGAGYRLCESIVGALLGVDAGELSRSRAFSAGESSQALALYALACHRGFVLDRLKDAARAHRPPLSVFDQHVPPKQVNALLKRRKDFGRRDQRARRWLRRAVCRLAPAGRTPAEARALRTEHARLVHQLLSSAADHDPTYHRARQKAR